MTIMSKKTRLTTSSLSTLQRSSAGAGIAGLVALSASQSASAQTNFQVLPGADFAIDQASGTARINYQGQMYQVNAGHYQIKADGSISISSEAAATVAPGLATTAVNTFGMPVDSSVLDVSADTSGGLFGGNNLLLGASVLGVVAAGVGGYFLYQSLSDDDDDNGSSGSGGGSTTDTVVPTLTTSTLGPVQAGERVTIELTASEAISGLTSSDFTVSGGELVSFTAESSTDYDIEIIIDNSSTAPSISIAAGAFEDAAGNDNAAFSETLTRTNIQNTTLWLPDNAFTTGAFDASGYSNFAELQYVGTTLGGATDNTLSITDVADNMTITIGSSAFTSNDTLSVTATTAGSDITVALNNSIGVDLGTLNTGDSTGNITGTVTLTSIGGAANSIDTLTSSASIVIDGGADTDTPQQLTIGSVGDEVSSIDASGFGAAFNVSGISDTDTTITGGEQADNLSGGNGGDTIDGRDGDDILSGGSGDDTINGGEGDDTISGGAGIDTIAGGAGVDTFVFTSGDTGYPTSARVDEISDFALEDKIDAAGHSVASGPVAAGTLTDGVYTFGTDNNPGTNLDAAIGEIKVLFGTSANIAVVFEMSNQDQYYYASFGQNNSSDDVLVSLGNDMVNTMVAGANTDAADVFSFT